jgi:hypothetical protein
LALGGFWLFKKIKYALNGRRFQDIEDILKKCDSGTESCSATGVAKKRFQQWQHHWAKCTAAQGKYFEGNPSQ